MTEIELEGIDGRNLLAFLASLGTMIALAHKHVDVTMRWNDKTYRPIIGLRIDAMPLLDPRDTVVRELESGLQELANTGESDRFPPDWNNITVSRSQFRQRVLDPAASRARTANAQRAWADLAVGLGYDADGNDKDLDYTDLCVITGDSRQDFLRFIRDLVKEVSGEHLKSALFERWAYRERGKSFRWNPQEDRRYALRASDPSKGPDKDIPSMWGANRLALEALACFPCFPRGRRVRTTGFDAERTIHWPLWSPLANVPTVKSLLALPALLQKERRVLAAMGVFAVASARRVSVGRKRSFAAASLQRVGLQ